MHPSIHPGIPEITVDQLADGLAAGTYHVLDVREDWEVVRGHVPGAIHVPLGRLVASVASLPRDRAIAVICQSGNRSLSAAAFLLQQGFAGSASVAGGTIAWMRSGRSVDQGVARVA